MFIGSSAEGVQIARAVEALLQRTIDCVIWPNAFVLSQTTIANLVTEFEKADFGLFVLSPDDHTEMRQEDHIGARDNVIFEAGLFMGRHGLERTFLVKPRDVNAFHMPTDLIGITTATYEGRRAKNDVRNALSPAATEIETAIREVERHEHRLDFHTFAREEPDAHWKLKAYVQITNNTQLAVALRSLDMELDSGLQLELDFKRIRQGRLVPEFNAGRDAHGHDTTKDAILARTGERVTFWLPIVPSTGIQTVRRLLESSRFGVWRYEEHWVDNRGQTRTRARDL
jgi:Predicted nucleotide-binding protein containing TIR-like domain